MKIFLTGATGYIGNVIAEKLLQAGHQVIGLTRSGESGKALEKQGIKPFHGDLNNPESLVEAARESDGVIHTAFDLDSHDFLTASAIESKAVHALISAMEGSDKPLIFTSGTGVLGDTGEVIYDEETPIKISDSVTVRALQMRLNTEKAVLNAVGIRGIVLRPPNVYGRGDGRVLFMMLRAAGQKLGAVPYAPGAGENLWSYVHVDDLADLFVLAIEKAPAGELFHAGAQSGLRSKDIATALSRGMGLGGETVALQKTELGEAFGLPAMADYWASNSQSSNKKAQILLGWTPQYVDLLREVEQPND
jgi:nucleoside-diphosphate-sugar epimerase